MTLNHHLIGEITLSVSSLVYFIWFIPQIWLNFKRRDTEGLSMWMHALLLFGYTADLLYGFGREMQWQYRFVTMTGLIWLCIQHVQILRYGLHTRYEKINFSLISFIFLISIIFVVINFTVNHHSKKYYDTAGYISDFCWMTYLFPQIIKNFKEKSTTGLSLWFMILAVSLDFFDITSALMLKWDWPSLLGSMGGVSKKLIVLFQFWYYRKHYKSIVKATKLR